jgi:hypothetical protein
MLFVDVGYLTDRAMILFTPAKLYPKRAEKVAEYLSKFPAGPSHPRLASSRFRRESGARNL